MTNTKEHHPYGNFVPKNSVYMLIGSFPIARFTNDKLRKNINNDEIDFSYGGKRSCLWKLLAQSFDEKLDNKTQIKKFLRAKGIAIGDVISSCSRKNGSSSDRDLRDITFNTQLKRVIEISKISHLLFTSTMVHKWFECKIGCDRKIKKTVLISPSGSGVRRLNQEHNLLYNTWRIRNPRKSISTFRESYYSNFFTENNFPNLKQ